MCPSMEICTRPKGAQLFEDLHTYLLAAEAARLYAHSSTAQLADAAVLLKADARRYALVKAQLP